MGTQKSGRVKKPTSVKPPLKREEWRQSTAGSSFTKSSAELSNVNSTRISLRRPMIVNRKSCDFTYIECHFKTDVTKVIHAIMEMEEHSPHESDQRSQNRWEFVRKFTGAKHVVTKLSRVDGWTPTKVWELKTITGQRVQLWQKK